MEDQPTLQVRYNLMIRSKELRERIAKLAMEERRSFSQMARVLLYEALDRRGA